ncbi:hypothetical protein P280DRAFT_474767 [Massarina eburnea CBS 473.64]|uniref:Citrate transporter-like domain-containing protein n=1 Tax=Massarina eburnea CBS 473.64 TaxID=1395130 RepID=A0A6A6RGB8_9PLEO|nr:hypothetical protein P280DRAFT_474767 [Massarina eburnea CBS 473.64]
MGSPVDVESIRATLDTSQIKSWRSILTLIVFVLTNINVLFPFTVPVYVPRVLICAISKTLVALRIYNPPINIANNNRSGAFVRCSFPMNFVTGPLIANLLLLATLSIGRTEVHDGTIGANNIAPYDIMLFFLSLAYIAISIDASGLIRYLAYRVLQSGGNAGHRLYLSLYTFFFVLTAAIGNDPVILSGSPFLAYMTRVSVNIIHPRAWIYSQFAVANIASAILVSSNPTNLVIAGAFSIKFINYTANIIIPVVVTGMVLFPVLLYGIFRDTSLIPRHIEMHQLSDEAQEKKPVNPNIPRARCALGDHQSEKELPLEEIMNPYLDKVGATVAASILAVTLVTLLIVNAVTSGKGNPIHAFWVTAPAAIVTFCFDLVWGWTKRHESRRIASEPRFDNHMVSSGEEEKHPTQEASSASADATPTEEAQETHTLAEHLTTRYKWFQVTFPTSSTVLAHLPFALVPFAFCMFVLVQALVTKGWVPVFAHGWDAWVNKTGTVGAIGGMGFISVILCNFAGTNIGTSILLSRIIQAWQDIHTLNGIPISNRTFWATVYSMVIGVNYGAFSVAFSASLAGLLWRDILSRKYIYVRSRDFVRYNLPIIATAMVVGCTVLVGQVYIVRDGSPYDA